MKSVSSIVQAILIAVVLATPVRAQESALTGTWEGQLVVPGASLTIVFHFTQSDDGTLGGTMDSPDQGASGIPLGSVTFGDSEILATVPSASGEYKGTLADATSLTGTWSQGGQSFALDLQKTEADTGSAEKKPSAWLDVDVTGTWMGRLNAGGTTLRVVFHFETDDEGVITGSLDSPDQGANGFPIGEVTGSGLSLMVTVPTVGGSFEGSIAPDRSAIDGTWTQGGAVLPLKLEPADDESIRMPERPQEPKPPYPYIENEVDFENPSAGAGVRLAGTLTVPQGEGPFPAAVLVTGSGPQNRDEQLLGHKPFLVLADHLTRAGIAVLRYDDRGIGESTGDFATATTVDFASDASAAVDFLKARPEIDPSRIGLVGHSEGGLIAPMVAADRNDLGFIVMMAGPGVPGAEIIREQAALIMRAMGGDAERIRESEAERSVLFKIVMSDAGDDEVKQKLRAALRDRLAGMDDAERKASGFSEAMIEPQVQQLASPWIRFFLSYDPRPALQKVTCPVLVINGELDLQVPPDQNLPEIEKALKTAGNQHFKIVEMPGLNHLFQPAKTGAPAEYSQIETTFAPEAMKVIADWILRAES